MQISIEEKHKKRKSFEPHGGKPAKPEMFHYNLQTYEKKCLLNLNATKVSLQYDKFVTNS